MKVGVLGTGNISSEFMAASQVAQVEVVGVFNRNYEKARDFADRYQIPMAYDDFDTLLQNEDIDTIYVGLPNGLHYDYAKKALQCGKNVLMEKPFCSTMKEFDELVVLAKKKDVFLIEMDRVTSLPNFQVLKYRMEQIGKVRAVNMDFCQYSRKYDAYLAGQKPNVFTTECSGGALMDLGVYCVNLAVALFGLPSNLVYVADKLESGVDVTGNLIMKYPECIVSIMVGKNSIGDKHTNIQGEAGTLMMDTVPSVISNIDLVTRNGSERVSEWQQYDGTTYTLFEMKRIIENNDKEAGALRLAQSRKVMKVLTTARRSAGIVFEADQKN